MGGRVPSGLVTMAHSAGVRVVKALVLDVDVADTAAVAAWAAGAAADIAAAAADGANVLRITQPPSKSTAVARVRLARTVLQR